MTSMDNFLGWLDDRIRQVQTQDAHLENTLRGITEQREALAEQLRDLEATRRVYAQWRPTGVPKEERLPLGAFGDLAKMTLVQACEALLMTQGPMTTAEMTDALTHAGKLHSKRHSAFNMVYSNIRKNPKFRQTPDRKWEVVTTTNGHDSRDGLDESATSSPDADFASEH